MLYQRGCRDGLWADNVLGRAFGDVCAHAKAGRLRAAIRCGVGTFLAAGLVGAVGQWLMTKSYMFAPPSIVAPVSYLRIVFSVFLGVILGDFLPNFLPSLGIALILISGILVSVSAGKKR